MPKINPATGTRRISLFAQHLRTWGGCTKCRLHEGRIEMVFTRGQVPCQVLFVGEAPGESEDILGRPFCGPAGQLLDYIIQLAGLTQIDVKTGKSCIAYAMTNLVCCIPRDEKGEKVHEPDDKCTRACQPRLIEFIQICQPRLIIAVGALARDYFDQGYKHAVQTTIPVVDIKHPAAILRANVTQQGLDVQRAVVTIEDAIQEYVVG